MPIKGIALVVIAALLLGQGACRNEKSDQKSDKIKVLILDGQNNHYIWPKSSVMIKDYLNQTGIFETEIYRTDSIWLGYKYNPDRPGTLEKYIEEYPLDPEKHPISADPVKTSDVDIEFGEYDLVVSNLGFKAAEWPEETKRKFEDYMKEGGGLVVVHAANNSWGNWPEFNKMIGLGAWGGRDSTAGPYVYYDDAGHIVRDYSSGEAGSHGAEQEFLITTREPEHPIMKGLPTQWLHAKDEMYDRMRGPFERATILATAYSDPVGNGPPWDKTVKGTGWHVPMLLTIEYGQGRVFHTTLGHFDYSMECAGFITTLQRGAEWAATGQVSQEIPDDFPSDSLSSSRPWKKIE